MTGLSLKVYTTLVLFDPSKDILRTSVCPTDPSELVHTASVSVTGLESYEAEGRSIGK